MPEDSAASLPILLVPVLIIDLLLVIYDKCAAGAVVSYSLGTVLTMLTIARVFLALAVYPLYKLTKYLYQEYTSPLKHLPGPKSTSWIYGNFKEIWESVPHFHCYHPHFALDAGLG